MTGEQRDESVGDPPASAGDTIDPAAALRRPEGGVEEAVPSDLAADGDRLDTDPSRGNLSSGRPLKQPDLRARETERPDPLAVIQGSAEAALIRGVDAAATVEESAQIARDADERTGEPIDVLSALQEDEVVSAFIKLSDQFVGALGLTEHGFRHANLVGRIAHNVLHHLGADRELCELAAVAGYLHDIGNVVTRANHGLSGAWIAYDALRRLDVDPYRVGVVLSAIGNHEEQYGSAIGPVGAAVILADKSDVHRSRVRKGADPAADIHDRVNGAVTHSFLRVDADAATITLELEIDTDRSTVIEYFEIFLDRMVMCRRAARTLGCEFLITANGVLLG